MEKNQLKLFCRFGFHNWRENCQQCLRCGRTRDKEHDWSRNCEICARCGLTRLNGSKWEVCGCSACQEQLEAAKRLADQIPDVNAKDRRGNTPLKDAVSRCHFDGDMVQLRLVKIFLDRGADVNAKCGCRETPLRTAAQRRHFRMMPLAARQLELIKLLLSRGACVDTNDQDGNTPLHSAAVVGDVEVVKLFLDCGANVDVPNREGRTPLSWAIHSKYDGFHENVQKELDEVIRLLKVKNVG